MKFMVKKGLLIIVFLTFFFTLLFIPPAKSQETVNYTPTSETHCINGKCWTALYSGVRYVYEDNTWKPIEKAKSLKSVWKKVYLEKDPDFDIDVVEVNYTYLELNLIFNPTNYTIDELKAKYPECGESKENDIKCNFKFQVKENICNKTGCWKKSTKYQYKYQLKDRKLKTDMKFIYKGMPLGKEFTFGGNSTTIILREPNTENVDDSYVDSSNPDTTHGSATTLSVRSDDTKRIYFKFNISSIPYVTIEEATLNWHVSSGSWSSSYHLGVYHVYDDTWTEETLTWNNQPCGTGFDNSSQCNLTAEQIKTTFESPFNVKNMLQKEVNEGDTMLSIAVRSDTASGTGYADIHSKEYTSVTDRPYLNITYSDSMPPQFSDNSTNSTIAGSAVEHRLKWTENIKFSGYIFSFDNCTGTFVNDTFVDVLRYEGWEDATIVKGNWTTGGTYNWIANNTESWEGSWSAQSPKGFNQNSWYQWNVSLKTAETLTFYWKVDTGSDDGLAFCIDNPSCSLSSYDLKILGHSVWKKETITIPAGNHALRWAYIVDSSYSGAGVGWLDAVQFAYKEYWSNVTKVINSTVGCTIRWRVYANDTSNNWNVSDTYSYTTSANQPPSVSTPKTYDENYAEQTNFGRGDKVVIRVNVTDPNGAEDIDKVLIEIIDNSSTVKVSNETMTSVSSVTDGYTYEYNYTLPSDATLGTWTINVYANDTQNTWGNNSTTFEVVDTTPPEITFISQTPSNLNESSTEPVTIIVNITDESGINLSKVAFFTGVNHTLTQDFYHYNWSWRYPANDLQPDMRRADNRNMSYWFEDVVFKESPDDIWTFAGYDNSTYEFEVLDSGDTYYTINVTFFSAQMLFPQIFPFDKLYLTAENKTGQYVELHKNNWMKIKFYPSVFYNYTTENYTIYIDLNVDPNFAPNVKPLEIYFCNSTYTTGDPFDNDYCVYVEDIDSTDTGTIVINQSSYIQNIIYISDGYIDGAKVSDEAYLVLRTTVPSVKAFRLYYADDEINQYINFTDFNHAWVSTDDGDTWNLVSYTPDFYLISTQGERDKVMYYVYACDNLDNCGNSSMQYDSLDPVNHPPAEPLITKPEENENVTGLYNITWLTIGDPDFDLFNASVYLCNPDGSINTTLADNNITGSNTQYEYYYEVNFSAFPSGKYRINVTLCDIHGLCSSSLTAYNFTVYRQYNKTIEQFFKISITTIRNVISSRLLLALPTILTQIAKQIYVIRQLPQTILATIELTKWISVIREKVQTITITSIITSTKILSISLSQTVVLTTTVLRNLIILKELPQIINVVEAVSKQAWIIRRLPQDIIVNISILVLRIPYIQPITISITNVVLRQVWITRSLTETIILTANLTTEIPLIIKQLTQTITITPSLIRNIIVQRFSKALISMSIDLTKLISIIKELQITTTILNIVTVSKIISASLSQTVALTTTILRSIVVQRITEVLPSIASLIFKSYITSRQLFQTITLTLTITLIKVRNIVQTINVMTQVSRSIYLTFSLVEKIIPKLALSVTAPTKIFYTLQSPEYSILNIFGRIENLILFSIILGSVSIASLVFIWKNRKQLYKPPVLKYLEEKKK